MLTSDEISPEILQRRCFATGQSLEAQLEELKAAGAKKIFQQKATGQASRRGATRSRAEDTRRRRRLDRDAARSAGAIKPRSAQHHQALRAIETIGSPMASAATTRTPWSKASRSGEVVAAVRVRVALRSLVNRMLGLPANCFGWGEALAHLAALLRPPAVAPMNK